MSEMAALVATEFVTNAVQHAHTRSLLQLGVDRVGLHLAVRDFRRAHPDPRPRPVDVTRAGGRGWHLVPLLAAAWGALDHPDGKTMWAQLRRTGPRDRDS